MHRLVRVLVSGVFDADEAPRMTADARAKAKESGLNILYDIREARSGRLENSDIFWLPRTVPALKDSQAPRVRVATVFIECQRPIVEFWETAFRNVGLAARAFDSEESAVAWLTGAA
ncbi:MAG: hypothetical protein H7Y14_08150 [Burkholderiales bacterium]|nr:hypothetical protein [Burkholderiales bacterium]